MKLTDIKKLKPAKISNPIPEAQRIFKCMGQCKQFYYMKDRTDGDICKACREKEIGKEDRTKTEGQNGNEVRSPDVCESDNDAALDDKV